jgi:geranylgeranyl diphosphate synthase type II
MELVHATNPNDLGTRIQGTDDGCSMFQSYLDTVKPKIDKRILDNIGSGPGEASIDRQFEMPLKHGKRMRAGLLMLLFDTFGEDSGQEMAIDLASAVEIAHAASLIIDDMLDDDDTRHGMSALHITAGHKNAMLGTIGLLSYPYQIASRYGDECVLGLARTHRAMVNGATRELKNVPSFGVAQAYDSIIEKKTGVLFCLAARYGAMAAGCPSIMTEQCSEFGMLTGKAMQIADDVADLRSLLNGKKARIGGSEAILLRLCLGQTAERTEDLERDMHEPVRPIGTERRKDMEDIMGRYLAKAIEDAVGAAQKLHSEECEGEKRNRHDHRIPELSRIPSEIATMVLNEEK